jgi:hypothetical protein
MAVRPEIPDGSATAAGPATICVITNVRVDHVEEIGRSLEDTAAALVLSVPRRGTLITADKRFRGRRPRVPFAEPSPADIEALSWFPYPEFAKTSRWLSARPRNSAWPGNRPARHGQGQAGRRGAAAAQGRPPGIPRDLHRRRSPRTTFVPPGWSWEEASRKVPSELPLVLLYNNRADREYRIREFLDLPRTLGAVRAIATIGDRPEKVARFFSRTGAETLAFARDTPARSCSLAGRQGRGLVPPFRRGELPRERPDIVSYCVEHGSAFAGFEEEGCLRNRSG